MEARKTSAPNIKEINPVYYKGDFSVCGEEWYYNNIVVGYDRFYFITEGECIINVNGSDHVTRPGQLFLFPFNSTQTLYTKDGGYVKKKTGLTPTEYEQTAQAKKRLVDSRLSRIHN